MSTGQHPMSYFRGGLAKLQVKRACDLPRVPHEQYTRVAGCVIARQRPGTAKSFVFLSLEDETGISKVIRITSFPSTLPASYPSRLLLQKHSLMIFTSNGDGATQRGPAPALW